MKYLDKEAELKRIKKMKELEMARAERDAVRALEDEENLSSTKEIKPSCQRMQEQGDPNLDATSLVPKESIEPLKSTQPCLPTLRVASRADPPSLPQSGPPTPPVKSESRTMYHQVIPLKHPLRKCHTCLLRWKGNARALQINSHHYL